MKDGLPAATPKATLIVFSYKQALLIRDAILGALSQTYSPLQIIFSDDCSTDDTFAIISEAVAGYDGPHEVIVRQTPENLGSFNHLVDAARLATGDLVVLAAGDDVSHPNRVERLVRAWQETGAWGLMSRCDIIDDAGRMIERDKLLDMRENELRRFFDHDATMIHGASSAYDRRAFRLLFLNPITRILHDDAVMSVVLNAHRKPIALVDETLVSYRAHAASTSNFTAEHPTAESIEAYERRVARSQESLRNAIAYLLPILKDAPAVRPEEMQRKFRFYAAAAAWPDASVSTLARAFARASRTERRWLAPRLFGFRAFRAIKLARAITRR